MHAALRRIANLFQLEPVPFVVLHDMAHHQFDGILSRGERVRSIRKFSGTQRWDE